MWNSLSLVSESCTSRQELDIQELSDKQRVMHEQKFE
jgi:hypothetical protein